MNGKRVTIYDIAKELSISTATVNRALTGKNKVSEETRQKVFDAAQRMGFRPNTIARSLARRPIRLAVVAFTSFPEFHNPLINGARETARELMDYNVQVDYFNYDQGASNNEKGDAFLASTLHAIAMSGYDGALICAKQCPAFQELREKHVFIATAVNDVERENRRFGIRYNAKVAGRIAAELLWRMGDGVRPVAVATGSLKKPSIHFDIQEGFDQQLKTTPLTLAEVYRHHDDPDEAYETTKDMLNRHPDLGGIYVDSFNSLGVVRAVTERGLGGRICIVTSDIYRELRGFISQGLVCASIFQNQFEQGRQGLRLLYHAIADATDVPDQVVLPPQIILGSNLELY